MKPDITDALKQVYSTRVTMLIIYFVSDLNLFE